MNPPDHDKLMAVLDVFIDEFLGQTRIRGITTALLIHRATLAGTGISASEIRKVTGAPLETIRRNFARHIEGGNLVTVPNPDDDRVVRYKSVYSDLHEQLARRLSARLREIGPPGGEQPLEQRPFGTATYDALINVLQAYSDVFDGGLRIRGIKIAFVILRASYTGEGITPSQISRQSGGALETVRRAINEYIELGILNTKEDPDDNRAYRVFYKDPEYVSDQLEIITKTLNGVDWSAFNLTDE